MEEHEIREVLNTMFQKAHISAKASNSRRPRSWPGAMEDGKGPEKTKGKQGKSKIIDQMKQNSRCAICKKDWSLASRMPRRKRQRKDWSKRGPLPAESWRWRRRKRPIFCGHLEVDPELLPDDQLAKLNDEMLFRLADPEDREMKEIYGDQYRHFEETYDPGDEWFWQDATEVETDVKEKSSLIPPSVAMPTTTPSRTEPVNGEHDPEGRLFDMVSSSHNVAGGKQHVRSRYKVQCMEIGGGIGSHTREVFFSGDDFGLRGKASENHKNLEGTRGDTTKDEANTIRTIRPRRRLRYDRYGVSENGSWGRNLVPFGETTPSGYDDWHSTSRTSFQVGEWYIDNHPPGIDSY